MGACAVVTVSLFKVRKNTKFNYHDLATHTASLHSTEYALQFPKPKIAIVDKRITASRRRARCCLCGSVPQPQQLTVEERVKACACEDMCGGEAGTKEALTLAGQCHPLGRAQVYNAVVCHSHLCQIIFCNIDPGQQSSIRLLVLWMCALGYDDAASIQELAYTKCDRVVWFAAILVDVEEYVVLLQQACVLLLMPDIVAQVEI